jgi:hypothetical protein
MQSIDVPAAITALSFQTEVPEIIANDSADIIAGSGMKRSNLANILACGQGMDPDRSGQGNTTLCRNVQPAVARQNRLRTHQQRQDSDPITNFH